MTTKTAVEPFDGWAMVELMGKRIRAGRCREVVMFGATLLRIEVPRAEGPLFDVEHYGGGAIYGLHPCSEAQARRIAGEYRYDAPLQPFLGINQGELFEIEDHSVADVDDDEDCVRAAERERERIMEEKDAALDAEIESEMRAQDDEDAAAEREPRPHISLRHALHRRSE